MKRNTIVLGVTLLLLAIFAWAGWANWEYRKQAAQHRADAATLKAALASAANPEEAYTQSPLLGKQAPSFTLQDLAGKQISLADYKGKALLINFWATWCGPCKLETPWLVELEKQYAPQGFEILGVDTEDDEVTPADKSAWAKDKTAVSHFVAAGAHALPRPPRRRQHRRRLRPLRRHAHVLLRQPLRQNHRRPNGHHIGKTTWPSKSARP